MFKSDGINLQGRVRTKRDIWINSHTGWCIDHNSDSATINLPASQCATPILPYRRTIEESMHYSH